MGLLNPSSGEINIENLPLNKNKKILGKKNRLCCKKRLFLMKV